MIYLKNTFLNSLALIFLSASCPAYAEYFYLSRLNLSSKYQGNIYNGLTQDAGGTIWDNSRFYKNKGLQLSGTVGGYVPSNFGVFEVIFNFDLGYDSQALTASPYFGLGFSKDYSISDNSVLSLEILNAVSLTRNIKERPCKDSFDRKFHCGTLAPWSDYLSNNNLGNRFHPVLTVKYFKIF